MMKIRTSSVVMLALGFLLNAATLLFAAPSAQVDFTKTVEDHSMLLLLLSTSVIGLVAYTGKLLFERADSKVKLIEAENKATGDKLRSQELSQLVLEYQQAKEKVFQLETLCHNCQKNLPFTYVAKADFEKFVESHREDINNIAHRVEIVIKDLKSELRSDMESQINRVIELLEARLK